MAKRGLAEAAEPFIHEATPKTLKRIRALPPRQRVSVSAKVLHTLMDRAEMAEDVRAFDVAKATRGALIPAEVMDRIWDGENRVLALREWRGLSQGRLAKSAGLSQSYLCEIEKGKNLSSRAAMAIASALMIDVGDVLVGHAKGKHPPTLKDLLLNAPKSQEFADIMDKIYRDREKKGVRSRKGV